MADISVGLACSGTGSFWTRCAGVSQADSLPNLRGILTGPHLFGLVG